MLHGLRMLCLLKTVAPDGLQKQSRSLHQATSFVMVLRLRYYKSMSETNALLPIPRDFLRTIGAIELLMYFLCNQRKADS